MLTRVEYECLVAKCINPSNSPDDKILDWSKLKQIADDIFKCILSHYPDF